MVQRQRCGRRRGVHEVRHDAILQERQRLVRLLRRQIMVSGAPDVPGSLGPLGRPAAGAWCSRARSRAHNSARRIPADQRVKAEGWSVHRRLAPRTGARPRRRAAAPPRPAVRVTATHASTVQHPENRRVQHEPGHRGRLLIEDLGDEVLRDRLAADLQCAFQPGPVGRSAQGQRCHLHDCGPASLC